MKFEVKNRWTGNVQFVAEIECAEDASYSVKLGLAVRWGVKSGANLSGANLYGATLSDANLSDANLSDANLSGANLYGADLSDANLYGADLSDANLSRADLSRADLSGVNLSRADLSGVNLSRADLSGVNLYGANHIADRVIDGGLRSDGYRFLLTLTEPGEFRIKAGCRNFTVSEAKAHWDKCRPKGEPLGDETRLIIKHMLAVAKARGWKPLADAAA